MIFLKGIFLEFSVFDGLLVFKVESYLGILFIKYIILKVLYNFFFDFYLNFIGIIKVYEEIFC